MDAVLLMLGVSTGACAKQKNLREKKDKRSKVANLVTPTVASMQLRHFFNLKEYIAPSQAIEHAKSTAQSSIYYEIIKNRNGE
jgi:hypothetical protein